MHKVLLVDDEELVRKYLKSFLEKQCVGYIVVGEACNGREAIEFIQKSQTDIIFMDIKMPGIDGLMASQKIKEFNPKIKIIILSAYEDFRLAQQALRVGANEYLVKPAQPEEILTALNQVNQKPLNDQLDIYCNISDVEGDFSSSNHLLDKEKAIIAALKQNDFKLLSATFNEYTNQLLRSPNTTKHLKLGLFEFIIIFSRTLVEFGLNEAEIRHFKLNNFQKASSIQNFSEVQIFMQTMQNQLIGIINVNDISGKDLINRILNYINTNIANNLSLECISQQFHFSSCHLSRLIKKETGLTYPEYLNHIRLAEAKRLLSNSNLSISKIALEVGYQEVPHFNRVFKKTVGINPSEYRGAFSLLKNTSDSL